VQGCVKQTKRTSCQDALGEAAPELRRLCHLGQGDGPGASLPELADPDLACSLGCANLFSPFFSACGGELWPTHGRDGAPLPMAGTDYEVNMLKGLDPVFSQAAAAFNQRCAVAGGRADGQVDFCAALPCEQCNDKDAPGCGWCSDRNACSNECTSTKGQCGARSPTAPRRRRF
jgi:hypothetical protein